jgi:hypothetical protein
VRQKELVEGAKADMSMLANKKDTTVLAIADALEKYKVRTPHRAGCSCA